MTVAGAPIRHLTTWKSYIYIQWSYSFLVFCSCIICMIYITLMKDTHGWNGSTVIKMSRIVYDSSFVIFYFAHLRIGFNLRKICLMIEETVVKTSRRFYVILSLCTIISFLFFLFSTGTFIWSVEQKVKGSRSLFKLITISLGIIARCSTVCSVIVVCFGLALTTATVSRFIDHQLTCDITGNDIEEYRLRFSKLITLIGQVDDVVHFPIAVILTENIFSLCCNVFHFATAGINFISLTLFLILVTDVILVCLSCGMVRHFVSISLGLLT